MSSYQPSCVIVSDHLESHALYEEVLRAEGFERISSTSLSSLSLSGAKGDIYLIDISKREDFELVEALFEDYTSEVILISAFKFVAKKRGKKTYIEISKPIQFTKFTSVLRALTYEINKSKELQTQQGLLTQTVEFLPTRVAIYDKNSKLIYANRAYLDALNVREVEEEYFFDDAPLCNLTFKEILHALSKERVFSAEREKDTRWFRSHFYHIQREEYIVHLCSDVTEKKSEHETLNREALFFKYTNEGVLITDDRGTILSVNAAFCKITGYTMDEAIGKSTKLLSSGIHTEDFYENMWESLRHHGAWQGEIWNRRKNGEIYPEWLSISLAVDPKTQQKNYLALFTDISSIKETDKKLHFYANHDHLTGLLNRSQFENMLQRAIKTAQRSEKKFALMFIDIDHFKEVNDTFGHNVGDLLLKNVSSIFQKTLRAQDLIARIGGDEFTILLETIESESDVLSIAEKLLGVTREPIVIEGHSCFISLSIGVAIYPTHGLDTSVLSKNADAAMYEVKKRGRDGVMLYNENFTDILMRRVLLQNDLKQALEKRELTVYFQPVVDAKTMKINKAEALIRWYHPKKGFISPEEFIPIAEQHGMILSLGREVLLQCFTFLPLALEQMSDFELAINISARELFDENYIENFFELVDDFGVDVKHIELEITETHVMRNHVEAIEKFKALKAKGVSLAIDDFGTGYSSLNYLKSFPIDKLKVDKSFVLGSLEDSGDRAIIESVVGLARSFSLKVQAEGVETAAHAALLKELGSDYLQGYHFAKAMSAHEFLEFTKIFNGADDARQ